MSRKSSHHKPADTLVGVLKRRGTGNDVQLDLKQGKMNLKDITVEVKEKFTFSAKKNKKSKSKQQHSGRTDSPHNIGVKMQVLHYCRFGNKLNLTLDNRTNIINNKLVDDHPQLTSNSRGRNKPVVDNMTHNSKDLKPVSSLLAKIVKKLNPSSSAN